MFFERGTQSSTRHRRLKYLLLFALRTALVLLVVLAFANPFVHRTATDAHGRLLLIVLDDSFSMRAGTRFANARQQALATLAAKPNARSADHRPRRADRVADTAHQRQSATACGPRKHPSRRWPCQLRRSGTRPSAPLPNPHRCPSTFISSAICNVPQCPQTSPIWYCPAASTLTLHPSRKVRRRPIGQSRASMRLPRYPIRKIQSIPACVPSLQVSIHPRPPRLSHCRSTEDHGHTQGQCTNQWPRDRRIRSARCRLRIQSLRNAHRMQATLFPPTTQAYSLSGGPIPSASSLCTQRTTHAPRPISDRLSRRPRKMRSSCNRWPPSRQPISIPPSLRSSYCPITFRSRRSLNTLSTIHRQGREHLACARNECRSPARIPLWGGTVTDIAITCALALRPPWVRSTSPSPRSSNRSPGATTAAGLR